MANQLESLNKSLMGILLTNLEEKLDELHQMVDEKMPLFTEGYADQHDVMMNEEELNAFAQQNQM